MKVVLPIAVFQKIDGYKFEERQEYHEAVGLLRAGRNGDEVEAEMPPALAAGLDRQPTKG